MQKTNIPFRKKINRTILSLALFVILVFLSNYAQINNHSQRILAKFFEIPQALISEVYEQIRTFETERVIALEKEIQLYQEKIYQQNLLIEELQNSGFFLFEKQNLRVIPYKVDYLSTTNPKLHFIDFLPSSSGLQKTEIALREQLGRLYYSFRW